VTALELQDAAVTRGGKVIWRDANVSVAPGTVTAVLGPNGAGKSTLLLCALGLVSLSGGSIEVLGESPRRGNPRVGYMPQSRRDAEQAISGRDYVALGYDGTHYGWRRGGAQAKVDAVQEALSLTGARAFADRPLRTLSGGQRQRMALAHATVFRPQLLLLDEPLAALDLAAQAEIVDLINLIRDTTAAAVVVVAHDLNPLSSLVDQVLWVARRQVRSGTPDEVVNESVLSELYGHEIEIVVTPRGRRVIVGLEEEFAHPHPHPHVAGHAQAPRDEETHEHFAEFYGDDS